MLKNKQIESLHKFYPVLSEIEQTFLEEIQSESKVITIKKGTLIFDELDRCDAFPFVLSGEIRVYKQSETGRELSLYNVTKGDVCVVTAGCLLGNKPYNASGAATSDSILIMMPSNKFEKLLGIKVFREYIFSLFSKRVLDLMELVNEVAFCRLDKRLASLLLNRGGKIFASHQELAGELGSVREMISRLLKSFSDEGLVILKRGQVEIIDEQGLKNISI